MHTRVLYLLIVLASLGAYAVVKVAPELRARDTIVIDRGQPALAERIDEPLPDGALDIIQPIGLRDPIILTERAAPSLSDAGKAKIYADSSHVVRLSVNGGAYATIASGGTIGGGGAANQVALFSAAMTIAGDADFTYDADQFLFAQSATVPTYSFIGETGAGLGLGVSSIFPPTTVVKIYGALSTGVEVVGFLGVSSTSEFVGSAIFDGGLTVSSGTVGSATKVSLTTSGKVQVAAGTAAAPSFTFLADTDTGFFSTSNNGIGFAAGGALRQEQTDTDLRLFGLFVNGTEIAAPAVSAVGNGRWYFDSTSHTMKLSVNGGAYADVSTGSGGGGGWTDDGTVVRLTTVTDQVGIGTAAPAASTVLHVKSTTSNAQLIESTGSAGSLELKNTGSTASDWYIQSEGSLAPSAALRFFSNTALAYRAGFDGDGDFFIGSGTTGTSRFNVGATDQFQVNATGNIVKLNNLTTSFPSVQATTGQVLTASDASGTYAWSTPSSGLGGSGTATELAFFTAGTTLASVTGLTYNSTSKQLTLVQTGATDNLLSIAPASTIAGQRNAIAITATLQPDSTTVGNQGINATFHTAGTGTSNARGEQIYLEGAGFTSSSNAVAGLHVTDTKSTGTTPFSIANFANFGEVGQALGVTVGNNVGVQGIASGSTSKDYGFNGLARVNSSGANIGGAALALNGGVGTQTGFYAGVGGAEPTLASAALLVDNQDQISPIALFRDAGSTVLSMGDDAGSAGTGVLTLTGDMAVNGSTSADVTTTTTIATLFNANATTLNIGAAVTTLALGAASMIATIRGTILGEIATSGTMTSWRIPSGLATIAPTKPSCAVAGDDARMILIDDTNDTLPADLCACGRWGTDDTTYSWTSLTHTSSVGARVVCDF